MYKSASAYMDISASTYFAVETMARLIASSPDRPCAVESLAQSIARSESYTEELLAELGNAGLVQATQGPSGGYYLARPADRITVAEIFRVFDEQDASQTQPEHYLTLPDPEITALCGAGPLWEALGSYIALFLEGVSLAAIVLETNGDIRANVANDMLTFRRSQDGPTRH